MASGAAGRRLRIVAAGAKATDGAFAVADATSPSAEAAISAPAPTAAEIDAQQSTTQTCSWAACGAELSGEVAAKNRCGRCKRVHYCSRRCQKRDWKEGGHELVCEEAPCCTICLDGGDEPLPVQRGCACRGDAGLAHVACQAQVAAHKGAGCWNPAWARCPTCGQRYTGAMLLGLAHEAVRRMEKRGPEDGDHLAARTNLGQALKDAGDLAGAEVLLWDVLAIRRRVYGRAEPTTRHTAVVLAGALGRQGHYAGAVALSREVLAATPAKEQEDEDTLTAKANLASALSEMGNHAEAEALLRGVHATKERLHGPDHARTLTTASQLGAALQNRGKHAEAEAVHRPTLAARRRILGPEHPQTLLTANNLAVCLVHQGLHVEAEGLLRGVLAVEQRTKGPGHADTLQTAVYLAKVQMASSTMQ